MSAGAKAITSAMYAAIRDFDRTKPLDVVALAVACAFVGRVADIIVDMVPETHREGARSYVRDQSELLAQELRDEVGF